MQIATITHLVILCKLISIILGNEVNTYSVHSVKATDYMNYTENTSFNTYSNNTSHSNHCNIPSKYSAFLLFRTDQFKIRNPIHFKALHLKTWYIYNSDGIQTTNITINYITSFILSHYVKNNPFDSNYRNLILKCSENLFISADPKILSDDALKFKTSTKIKIEYIRRRHVEFSESQRTQLMYLYMTTNHIIHSMLNSNNLSISYGSKYNKVEHLQIQKAKNVVLIAVVSISNIGVSASQKRDVITVYFAIYLSNTVSSTDIFPNTASLHINQYFHDNRSSLSNSNFSDIDQCSISYLSTLQSLCSNISNNLDSIFTHSFIILIIFLCYKYRHLFHISSVIIPFILIFPCHAKHPDIYKMCATGSAHTGVDGEYKYLQYNSTTNGSIFYNEINSKYLYPFYCNILSMSHCV